MGDLDASLNAYQHAVRHNRASVEAHTRIAAIARGREELTEVGISHSRLSLLGLRNFALLHHLSRIFSGIICCDRLTHRSLGDSYLRLGDSALATRCRDTTRQRRCLERNGTLLPDARRPAKSLHGLSTSTLLLTESQGQL